MGIKFTQEDFKSARQKSGVDWKEESDNLQTSISFSGSHDTNTSWTSEEMTALLNDRPWKYWPISEVQLKINNDGTAEMSGIFDEKKLEGYAAAIGTPQVVVDRLPILPSRAAFYLKGTGSLSNNQVSKFDITSAKLNRIPIPTGLLLGRNQLTTQTAYADDVTSELAKYSGKKAHVVNFINEKLSWVKGFFASRAEFKDGKIEFEGKLPDQEITAR